MRDCRKASGQRGDIDGDLSLRIAVIGIDADHFQRPASVRRGHLDSIADGELQTTGQLFADEASIASTKAKPGVCGRLQQRPAIPIDRLIGQAENLDRRSGQLRLGTAAWHYCLHLGTLPQPRSDLGSLRVVSRVEIDVRCQSSVEPTDKSSAEGFHHRADADIDGEREQ